MSSSAKKTYWNRVVGEIEKKAAVRTQLECIRKFDFSLTLPKKLRKRVGKILPYEYDEYDKNAFITESTVETPVTYNAKDEKEEIEEPEIMEKKKPDYLISDSEVDSHESSPFVLQIDKPLETKPKTKNITWTSSFISKPRKRRVCWDSKLYDMECSIWEKTLDEQAEELMDASAERFTTWINTLGSNRDSDITKEQLKDLFSIEGERMLLASIMTAPKGLRVVPKLLADKLNLPNMSIEMTYENYMKNRLKYVPKKIVTVAFGRTIPLRERPWQPSDVDEPIKAVFPDELLSLEKLFKGITHLRSTKYLVDFYKNQTDLERPYYLVQSGMFKEKTKAQTVSEVPLYERLKLKY